MNPHAVLLIGVGAEKVVPVAKGSVFRNWERRMFEQPRMRRIYQPADCVSHAEFITSVAVFKHFVMVGDLLHVILS